MGHLPRPVPSAARGAVLPRRPAPPPAERALAALPVAMLSVALLAACGGPVELARPGAADRSACAALAPRLPHRLADLAPVDVTPKDAYGGAWGDPAITLTCGADEPRGFGPASSCITVNGVDWFAPDDETDDNASDITLTTVTLKPRVALHVPAEYRGAKLAAALADLATPLKRTLTVGTRCQ